MSATPSLGPRAAKGDPRRRPPRKHPTPDSIAAVTKPTIKKQPREPFEWRLQEVLDQILPSKVRTTDSGQPFPEIDDLGMLGLGTIVQEELLRKESKRLTKSARDLSKSPVFSPKSNFMQHSDSEGYDHLWRVSLRLQAANSICRLQSHWIIAVHCKRLLTRSRLATLIERVLDCISEPEGAGADLDGESMLDLTSYISVILTRLIIQTFPSSHWQIKAIGILVKRITMIKVILTDLRHFANIVVAAARSTLNDLPEDSHNVSDPSRGVEEEEECEEYMRQILRSETDSMPIAENQAIVQHCIDQYMLCFRINKSLRDILKPMKLGFLNLSGVESRPWEICAVAHEIGFKAFKNVLYQQPNSDITATSDIETMDTAHSAFALLHQVVKDMHRQEGEQTAQGPAPVPRATSNVLDPDADVFKTSIEWDYQEGERHDMRSSGRMKFAGEARQLELKSMKDIVSVMIPLLAASPEFLENFTKFRYAVAMAGPIHTELAAPIDESSFMAYFRMHTGDSGNMSELADRTKLSKAFKENRFCRAKLVEELLLQTPLLPCLWKVPNPHVQMEKHTREMDDWIIEENWVTINCGWYVWSVVIFASCLVFSGLAIGFSVGERILGVDPSNLATYLWVTGAFVVLVGKSIKVGEWSWNDFLLRRVRCKSVSEIYAITAINPQLILAKLLHHDYEEAVLQTRGMFCSFFRNNQSEGFSIDIPVKYATMRLIGIPWFEEETATNRALVSIDLRKRAPPRVTVSRVRGRAEKLHFRGIIQAQSRSHAVERRLQPWAMASDGRGSGIPACPQLTQSLINRMSFPLDEQQQKETRGAPGG